METNEGQAPQTDEPTPGADGSSTDNESNKNPDDQISKLRSESAKYRTRAREAEKELEGLKERVGELESANAEATGNVKAMLEQAQKQVEQYKAKANEYQTKYVQSQETTRNKLARLEFEKLLTAKGVGAQVVSLIKSPDFEFGEDGELKTDLSAVVETYAQHFQSASAPQPPKRGNGERPVNKEAGRSSKDGYAGLAENLTKRLRESVGS